MRYPEFLSLVLALCFLWTSPSCKKVEDPYLNVNAPQTIQISESGGSEQFTISSNRDWSISATESWCKVSPSSGKSSSEQIPINVTCEANTTDQSRSCIIYINAAGLNGNVTIEQGAKLELSVSENSFSLSNDAQTIEVEISTNVAYSASIDSAAKDWISLPSSNPSSASKLTFDISANEGYESREGKIYISSNNQALSKTETIIVKQGQTDAILISTPDYELSNESHELNIEVKANVEFEVIPKADWIHYVSTRSLSSSTVSLSIDKNETYDERVGTVEFVQRNGDKSSIVTITQGENLGLMVSPESFEISKEAQTLSVEVKHNVDFEVIIPDSAKDWITLGNQPSTKSLNAQTFVFNVKENTDYTPRETSITVKQTNGSLSGTIIVKQSQTDILKVDQSEFEVDVAGGDVTVSLFTNLSYTVNINSDAKSWLSVKSKDNDKIIFSVAECDFETDRTGYVYLKGGDLEQTIKIHQYSPNALKTIEFSSSVVKKVCVAQFDSNNDGELSYGEAAKVEVIKANFFGDYADGVTTFDELQYFTSLTRISDKAFYNCAFLKSIHLPESVTHIGSYAFGFDQELSHIILPDSIISIGSSAFYYCEKADVNIPKHCKSIGERAFSFSGIRTALIPEGVTIINDRTFEACSLLSEVSLPSTLTRIGLCAFNSCPLVESIVLPDALTYLGSSSFSSTGIKQITIPHGVVSIPESCFNSTLIEELTLPENVATVGSFAFAGCNNLKKVTLKNADVVLGVNPFAACESLEVFEGALASSDGCYLSKDGMLISLAGKLTEYSIPEGIECIGERVAQWMTKLTKIEFPSSLREIKGYAFWHCSGLSEVIFSEGLITIGEASFLECYKLKTIILPDSIEIIRDYAFDGPTMDKFVVGSSCKEFGGRVRSNMVDIHNCYMRCTVPPENCPFNIEKLYVPKGTLEAYNSSAWKSKYTVSVEEYTVTD